MNEASNPEFRNESRPWPYPATNEHDIMKPMENPWNKEPKGVVCPFCKEDDFDLIGLKIHFIQNHCEQFLNTPLADPKPKNL